MKRSLALTVLVLLSGILAFAQDVPKVETFVGYTYTRFNSATDVPAFSANGGSGQFAVNLNKYLGFVADVGAVHNGNISDVSLDSTITNFLFGPRVSLRYSRFRPYVNVMFGGVYASSSIPVSAIILPPGANLPGVTPGTPVSLRAGASQTAFAMAAGGGLDIRINEHVSFRPVGLDYFMTRLQNFRTANDNNQNNLRYTVGVNFTFGAR
jgi:opacity protein-like surface antigen